jgi:hypothetical protein
MNVTEQKIKQARQKSIEWIEYLATKPEKDLERRLRINHQQYAIAVKEKMEDVCELLNIMERIIIEARIYKAENNIADAPNEIELAIADIETFVAKTEERREILNDFNLQGEESPSIDQTHENNDNQLSLF